MASKSEQVKEKQSKVVELSKLIALHSSKKLTAKQLQDAENEQFKIEYRLLELEELGLDAKIEGMTKILRLLQSIK